MLKLNLRSRKSLKSTENHQHFDPLNLTRKSGLFDYDDDICFAFVVASCHRKRRLKETEKERARKQRVEG